MASRTRLLQGTTISDAVALCVSCDLSGVSCDLLVI